MKKTITLVLVLSLPFFLFAQIKLTENTLRFDSTAIRQSADIKDMEWYTGRWVGEGFGAEVEENFAPAMGGTMIGTFRMVNEEGPVFYEMLLIEPDANSLVYKVKHFNPDFKGWEEKEDHVSFPLIKIEGNRYYFDGLTFVNEGDKCTHYLAMKQKDGSHKEAVLTYRKNGQKDPGDLSDVFKTPDQKTKLLLLGSYHMGNPGADAFNLESDDVLAPKRQEEIKDVVKKLAAFKPTKICVEAPFGDSATVARYEQYVNGKKELDRNEEEQIGFRLAKMLGHKTIYPIDVRMNLDDSGIGEVVGADPAKHGPLMGQLEQFGGEAMRVMGEWLAEKTIGEMLYEMNQPVFNDLNYQTYLRFFLPIVKDDNYAGADMVASWNQRNLRIMSNLHQIGVTPEDRVLIIFGQGHTPLFERIAKDSPYFEVVNVLPYLK